MPTEEFIDVVDEEDIIVDKKSLDECLRRGLLHRAVAVIIRNESNQIFLQRRSMEDDVFPDFWTLSSTGHVHSGESCDEAAKRELFEETGIECKPRFLFKMTLPEYAWKDRREHEIAYVYEAFSRGQVSLDSKEVSEGAFLSFEECRAFFRSERKKITPDAITITRKYLVEFAL